MLFVSDRSRSDCISLPFAKAQRYVMQLKSQINSLEAELEDQRAQKQRALLENEQLRMELEGLRRSNTDHESLQTSYIEAESKSCAVWLRFWGVLRVFSFFWLILTQCRCSNAVIVVQKDHKPLSSGTPN